MSWPEKGDPVLIHWSFNDEDGVSCGFFVRGGAWGVEIAYEKTVQGLRGGKRIKSDHIAKMEPLS